MGLTVNKNLMRNNGILGIGENNQREFLHGNLSTYSIRWEWYPWGIQLRRYEMGWGGQFLACKTSILLNWLWSFRKPFVGAFNVSENSAPRGLSKNVRSRAVAPSPQASPICLDRLFFEYSLRLRQLHTISEDILLVTNSSLRNNFQPSISGHTQDDVLKYIEMWLHFRACLRYC